MNEEIIINEQELVDYIAARVDLTEKEIAKVLDLEMEFLESKGVIE